MRSTVFVILSIMVHMMAVAAIALNPQRLSETGVHGADIEVVTGAESEVPGAADAPAEKVTEAPPAVQPVVEKPVEKVQKKATSKKIAVKALPPKQDPAEDKTEPVVEPTPEPVAAADQAPEQLDPVIDENVQTAPVAQQEEAPSTTPVAAAAASTATKATATEDINSLTQGGELGQGGATKAGAVEYTELKQMDGNRGPLYPMAARREKRQGNVELRYRVTKEGHVADVQVETSSGSEDLDKEAVRAISKFRFVPGQEGWARHPVQFTLKGDTAEAPSRLRTKVGAQAE
ncbi:MAG: energy transducer TonB [Bdellovibrionales bacterium]|nr:energy transducer TonB [Bdellovibrionales bacterium]